MTTKCGSCGRNITQFEVNNENFVACRYCHRFTPKNNVNNEKVKGGLKMVKENKEAVKPVKVVKEKVVKEKPVKAEKVVKEKVDKVQSADKPIKLSAQIIDLLKKNIPVEDIVKQLNCTRKQVLDTRWRMNHQK